jgi:hypothetical protein
MARKENDLTCFALAQMVQDDVWNWTDKEKETLAAARLGNVAPMMAAIGARLMAAGMEIDEAHGILHNEDVREVWDETACAMVLERKHDHIHAAFRFKKGKGGTLTRIASVVGLEPQYIEKAGKGCHGWDNLLSYLIHAKDEDKHPYSPDAVVSLGPSYREIYKARKADWDKGRAKKSVARAAEGIDELEAAILSGQVTKSQIILTDRYYSVYCHYKRRCDDAFEIYGERRAYKTIQALQAGEFKLSVFFITGQAGAGKTRFAKSFADMLMRKSAQEGEAWRLCQTAATNPMDDYQGEEILLMDDVRGGSLSASDWLKLLDPYNISPASARYRNKVPACRCIIITSSKEPLEFFYYCKQIGGDRSEALDQFMRRIQSTVQVIRADDWTAPEYMIADSKRTPPKMLDVPGSDGVQVKLSYGFGDEKKMDEAGALEYLAGVVESNSNLNKAQA